MDESQRPAPLSPGEDRAARDGDKFMCDDHAYLGPTPCPECEKNDAAAFPVQRAARDGDGLRVGDLAIALLKVFPTTDGAGYEQLTHGDVWALQKATDVLAALAAPAPALDDVGPRDPESWKSGWNACVKAYRDGELKAPAPALDAPSVVDITGIDAIRRAVVVEMENEGVVSWGDAGHRARFLEPSTPPAPALDAERLARLESFAKKVAASENDTAGTRAAARYALTGTLDGVVDEMRRAQEARNA